MLRTLVFLALPLTAACDRKPTWNHDEHRMIYREVLSHMRGHLSVDTLVVDPRPRFLVEVAGGYSMGDYSMFGDPLFADAIHATPGVIDCRIERARGCDTSAYKRVGTVSEIHGVGPREAGVLVSFSDMRAEPFDTRELLLQLRFANGKWRVVRIMEGGAVGQDP
jgi:hypothetical protein